MFQLIALNCHFYKQHIKTYMESRYETSNNTRQIKKTTHSRNIGNRQKTRKNQKTNQD